MVAEDLIKETLAMCKGDSIDWIKLHLVSRSISITNPPLAHQC